MIVWHGIHMFQTG